jgi:cytochrome c biogenesis protein CcmG, thiol:disulfide interchange protein DsbE
MLYTKVRVRAGCSMLLVGLLLIMSGCKDASSSAPGGLAPAISCNDVRGEYFQLGQLKNSVVVVYFWSSKCCGDSLKRMQLFHDQQKYRGVSLVAVEVGGGNDSVASFVNGAGLSFTNLTDEYGTISKSYRVIGYPTIFVIDKKGVVQKKISGEIKPEQLVQIIAPFL